MQATAAPSCTRGTASPRTSSASWRTRSRSPSRAATTTTAVATCGALDLLRRTRHEYPYHRVVSHKFPLAQVNEAFAQQHGGHVTRASLVP
jgi:hypothetical protein